MNITQVLHFIHTVNNCLSAAIGSAESLGRLMIWQIILIFRVSPTIHHTICTLNFFESGMQIFLALSLESSLCNPNTAS